MISEIKAASLFSTTILTEYYSGEDPRHRPCSDRKRCHPSPVEKVPPHFFVIFKKRQYPVPTKQKTGLTNFSSFLVWCGLEKGITCGCDHYGALKNHFPVH